MKKFTTIAIDGGAGSGKSTTATNLSTKLNFLHVDTGSHYRSIASVLNNESVGFNQIDENLNKFKLSSSVSGSKSLLLINDNLVPESILRSEEVNNSVSKYASISSVRNLLFEYQRSQVELAKMHNFNGLVMEGRDIGSIILPNADLKLFLHAPDSIRQNRRSGDGEKDQILQRDQMDTSRKVAPLVQSVDSIMINTGELSIEEVFSQILSLINDL
jgi:cytidylate kinase